MGTVLGLLGIAVFIPCVVALAAGVLGGIVWALRNPTSGVVEPDDIDYEMVLEIATPYLGEMAGVYSNWTPLLDRSPPNQIESGAPTPERLHADEGPDPQ